MQARCQAKVGHEMGYWNKTSMCWVRLISLRASLQSGVIIPIDNLEWPLPVLLGPALSNYSGLSLTKKNLLYKYVDEMVCFVNHSTKCREC